MNFGLTILIIIIVKIILFFSNYKRIKIEDYKLNNLIYSKNINNIFCIIYYI